MKAKLLTLSIVLMWLSHDSISQDQQIKICSDSLICDTRQLIKILEDSHPDPYINFGGKISFHRDFQNLLASIPMNGLTKKEYYDLLVPFIAKMRTMHTGLINPEKIGQNGPGIPLKFKIIETDLVVIEVPSTDYKEILGCKLESVNGVPFKKLIERQKQLRGIENQPGELAFLSISLKTKNGIRGLIPEWNGTDNLIIEFKSNLGKILNKEFQIPFSNSEEPISCTSKFSNPKTDKSDVVYDFVDDKKQTALLVISNMERYREASELWYAEGFEEAGTYTSIAYEHFNHTKPPTDRKELLKGIPSATETFVSLVQDLKKNNSKNLIVDLRDNTGGNGFICDVLIYFLFGKEGIINNNQGYQITKYSDLYFQNYSSDSLPLINKDRRIPISRGDYNFDKEAAYFQKEIDTAQNERYFKLSSTFYDIYKTKQYDIPQINLKNIMVICNPLTTSSGFNLLTHLNDKGAKVVGTASAQPGNNFGDAIFFQLNYSGLKGYVSFKQNITFPNDPVKGNCLIPDYPLTYNEFQSYNFDPNAEILYALDILKLNSK